MIFKNIADKADMIINGYAFKKCDEGYQVMNLNKPNNAVVLSISGDVLVTSMDDIEIEICSCQRQELPKELIRMGEDE